MQAARRLRGNGIASPLDYFPLLCRGSWMNDTNQVTVFSDELESRAPGVSTDVQTCMQQLWKLDLSELLLAMKALKGPAAVAAENANRLIATATNIDEFSRYQRFDHLDILKDDPAAEYATLDEMRADTIIRMQNFVASKLRLSTTDADPGQRRSVTNVTLLGRALHTVADFFAHTNYVELLYWRLAEERKLSTVLEAFNGAPNAFEKDHPDLVCPLPVGKTSAPRENGIIWYGPDAEQTPLVSSVFDTEDTAFSLTHMYAAHLENPVVAGDDEKQLSLVLAIMDVPGRPLAKGAWDIYKLFSNALEAVGTAAKNWLADTLENKAQDAGAAKGALEATAELLRRFDTATAGKWAQAGRMHYVSHVVERRMSARLDEQRTDQMLLPHHTLLSKDHAPETPQATARYNLACALAADVTADLLTWHFGQNPGADRDRFRRIGAQWLRHPAKQLTHGAFNVTRLASLAKRAFFTPWGRLTGGKPVFELR